ncbi:hypothetical protein [Hominenteromicrobium sp.]
MVPIRENLLLFCKYDLSAAWSPREGREVHIVVHNTANECFPPQVKSRI